MVLALQVLVDEVREQLFEDTRGVLHLSLQRRHDQRGHVATVTHGEGALGLQGSDEGQQEVLLGQQLAEQREGLLNVCLDLGHTGGTMGVWVSCDVEMPLSCFYSLLC